MSNIYIQEPPTFGKVMLETTVGDIDIELWSKEAPLACRNFVKHCMDGYYNGTIFHRLVKGFIVQGGDPTGTGTGGRSIYSGPFKDEFHTRLRFVRRGLVAMANSGKDDNGSQFFFTLALSPELQNKNTIFAKVVGDTLYNMLKLEDGLVDRDDRPLYPHKILSATVLNNPFPDLHPVDSLKADVAAETDAKVKPRIKKNFKLLSFGDEAEEDDMETTAIVKGSRGKSKSSHDLANDPCLSSVPVIDNEKELARRLQAANEESNSATADDLRKRKLNSKDVDRPLKNVSDKSSRKIPRRDSSEHQSTSDATLDRRPPHADDSSDPKSVTPPSAPEVRPSGKRKQEMQGSKNSSREEQTLKLLEKFKSKLHSAKETEETLLPEASDASEDNDSGWLTHTLNFESSIRQAKDANVKDEDTFEIYDPRNLINQRRRETSKELMRAKRRK